MLADDGLVRAEHHNAEISELLSIPSFPEISNEWRYTGSRYQGPNRASLLQGASSFEEHTIQSNELPFLTETGHRIFPDDLQDANSFIAQRGNAGIKGFRLKQLSRIPSSCRPSANSKLLAGNGVGGPAWRGKFALGFPILGELGEPGVYPPSNQPPSYISRKELFDKDAGRFLSSKTTSDPNERLLWFEAIDQVKKKGSMGLADTVSKASSL